MIKGEEYACDNDWWSLVVLLYKMLQGDVPFYNEIVSVMYEQILHSPLVFSRSLSADAKCILIELLCRDKTRRLCSASSMKMHPFFNGLDFNKLLRKQLPPPFVPDLKNDDTRFLFVSVLLCSHQIYFVVFATKVH